MEVNSDLIFTSLYFRVEFCTLVYMKAKTIDEMPLPTFDPNLTKETKTKAQLIFYRRDIRLAGWYLRARYGLSAEMNNPSREQDAQDRAIFNDPVFRLNYQALLSILPADTYKRWEPCFREFVFYNHVGAILPDQGGVKNTSGGYKIKNGTDIYGEYVEIRIYNQLSTENWKDIKRTANKKLVGKTKLTHSGADLELIVTVANLKRSHTGLTYSDIAGNIEANFEHLANKGNGYNEDDIRKIYLQAQKLGF